MAKHESLHDLLLEQMQDLYDAEHRLVEALPKMAEAANNEDLSRAFANHLKETEKHVKRLEQAFAALGEKAERKTCPGIIGLLKEGEEFIKGKGMSAEFQDAGLIAAAQRVEHYELAGYGCVVTYARSMGHDEAAKLLDANKDEERNADLTLNALALNAVNPAAQDLSEDESMRTGAQDKGRRMAGVR